ncbi:FliM/FliN family flagellar motor switch protein [Pseudoalteromonas shioyasakiensis]|uniref:FliM/FliN family flagellar motor switch protein n=1 Tax=Pseudoalteromonas shioyasakiensis TaxID=1190813 RepID=UPI00211969AD|nr:FliM/FliN family flagellar motor switch protein [Pseudoalteromonas shioyasakiensis]MCQ8877496.1 FliM/FliN family flagellar motor switch protein [Pseudoalteromonas shioyasakiensis]
MKNFRRPMAKLITANMAEALETLPLTIEQRAYSAAVKSAANVKLNKALELELAQLFNDSQFSIEVNSCSYSAVKVWFEELPRVFVKGASLIPADEEVFLALDCQSAHRVADLCLGGVLNPAMSSDAVDDLPHELSVTETRICGRLLQRQVQGIQQLLFKERSSLLGELCKSDFLPDPLDYLVFKVRLVLDTEVVSWYIWLPVSFFNNIQLSQSVTNIGGSTLSMHNSHLFPVKGSIEMAAKKVTLKQLKACMNGAILPIELHDPALFKLGNKVFFSGQVAEQDTNLTFQITNIF